MRDLSDSNPAISFDSATYFAERHHTGLCKMIGVNHEELRNRAIECLKESGVRRKRMVNDLIEDFNDRNSKLN